VTPEWFLPPEFDLVGHDTKSRPEWWTRHFAEAEMKRESIRRKCVTAVLGKGGRFLQSQSGEISSSPNPRPCHPQQDSSVKASASAKIRIAKRKFRSKDLIDCACKRRLLQIEARVLLFQALVFE
jgi:hypothetical protein